MNRHEEIFYSHMTNVDSLDVIAQEGFSSPARREVLPSETGRKILAWVLDYYFETGRKVAPSKQAIMSFWGDEMEAASIEINDEYETDSVEWAIAKLREEYARWRSEQLLKEIAVEVNQVDGPDVVSTIVDSGLSFYELAQSLVGTRAEARADEGLLRAVQRHQELAQADSAVSGLTFDMPLLDEHMGGVKPGELCVVAAFSGVGKSWMSLKPMIAEWKRGRRNVLFTLENDLDMTFDRMACQLAKVDYTDWQRGEVDDAGVERVMKWVQRIKESDHAPYVIMPQAGETDPVALAQKARLLNADSFTIDQLSHVEPPPGLRSTKRNEIVQATVSALSKSIKGTDALPCLLLHQIKREGHDRARRTNSYVMEDLAESSQVERESSHILAIYQSEVMKATGYAQLQALKFRKARFPVTWEMRYRPHLGDIRIEREIEEDDD